jgi:hypothetical protein
MHFDSADPDATFAALGRDPHLGPIPSGSMRALRAQ